MKSVKSATERAHDNMIGMYGKGEGTCLRCVSLIYKGKQRVCVHTSLLASSAPSWRTEWPACGKVIPHASDKEKSMLAKTAKEMMSKALSSPNPSRDRLDEFTVELHRGLFLQLYKLGPQFVFTMWRTTVTPSAAEQRIVLDHFHAPQSVRFEEFPDRNAVQYIWDTL